jgi:hypothetical protein
VAEENKEPERSGTPADPPEREKTRSQAETDSNMEGGNLHSDGEGAAPPERAPEGDTETDRRAARRSVRATGKPEDEERLHGSATETPGTRPGLDDADARARQRQAEAAGQPVVAHTPTHPLGTAHTDPDTAPAAATQDAALAGAAPVQPLNAEEADKMRSAHASGEPAHIKVAPPAAVPTGYRSQASIEVAEPAPVPRPGDENLTAGTESHYERTGRKGQQEPD